MFVALFVGPNCAQAQNYEEGKTASTVSRQAVGTDNCDDRILVVTPSSTFPKEPGEYAIFDTSLGSFVAKLFPKEVPTAVNIFAGLAEGTKTWRDPEHSDNIVKRPFYNGLIFHRVIDGFMIQGGCPAGTGVGGPGFKFMDEFSPKLKFDKEGVIAFANSGPNSNGSQFFITLGPTPHLDQRHTIIGQIVYGMDIVHKIGATKVDRNQGDRPVVPVVIKSIKIARVTEANRGLIKNLPKNPMLKGGGFAKPD